MWKGGIESPLVVKSCFSPTKAQHPNHRGGPTGSDPEKATKLPESRRTTPPFTQTEARSRTIVIGVQILSSTRPAKSEMKETERRNGKPKEKSSSESGLLLLATYYSAAPIGWCDILWHFHRCQTIPEELQFWSEQGYNRLNAEARLYVSAGCIWYVRRVRLASATMKRSRDLQIYKIIQR